MILESMNTHRWKYNIRLQRCLKSLEYIKITFIFASEFCVRMKIYIHTRYNNSIPEKALWKQTLLTWSILNLLLPSKYFPCEAIASSLEIFLELVFSYIFPLYVLAFCFRVELKTSRFMIGNNRVKHYIKKSDKMGNWYFFLLISHDLKQDLWGGFSHS